MFKKISFKKIGKKTSFFAILIFLASFAGSIILADSFSGPISSPPSDNAPVPLNVTAGSQVKTGGLSLGSLIVNGGSIFNNPVNFNGSGYSSFRFTDNLDGRILFDYGTGSSNDFRILTGTGSAGSEVWTERFRITSSGNVGIGTTAPGTRLQIGDSTVSTANKLTFGKTVTTAEVNLPTIYQGSVLSPGSTSDLVLNPNSTGGGLVIKTSQGDKVVVTAAGNVGIGTTSPTSKLDVRGRVRIDWGSSYDVWIQGGSASSGTARNLALLGIKNLDELRLNYGGEYTGGVRIQGPKTIIDGNVGIGTTSPPSSAILDLTSTTKGFLAPRMTTTQRDAIASPSIGLQIYNTSTNSLNIYNGTSWVAVGGGVTKIDELTDAQNDSTNDNIFLGQAGFTGTFYNNYNTALGRYAFDNPNTNNGQSYYGDWNTAIGRSALGNNATGYNNSAVGGMTLYSNTTGYYNSAMGLNALRSNTTGSRNSAMGVDALRSNTTGSRNSAMGVDALRSNTTGNYNSAMGLNALYFNTDGWYNSAMGADALRSNTSGHNNSAMGLNALRSNTTGGSNSAMGLSALRSNTTGNYNSAMGVHVLHSNTTGYNNSAMGAYALYFNTTGSHNSAMGRNALYSNTTGSYNSAMGLSALHFNTTGSRNSAMGIDALHSNTTGSYNSAMGLSALHSNTTGYDNSAMGVNALHFNTTGSYNSAMGLSALYSNITGSYNSAMGLSAGRYIANGSTGNTTGDYNVFLGAYTKALADNDQNEIVIGYNATGNGSNSATLGNDSITKTVLKGNVGIGTTNPGKKLEIYDDGSGLQTMFKIGRGNATKTRMALSNSVQTWTLDANEDGAFSISEVGGLGQIIKIKKTSGYVVFEANAPTLILKDKDHRSSMVHQNSNTFYILRGCGVASESWCQYNSRWPFMINLENNDITIGRNLDATGGSITSQAYYYSSDRKLKKDIKKISKPLDLIARLEGVSFRWKENNKKSIGFIAQSVEKVYPELVGETTEGYKTVQYGNITALLVEGIKELKKENETLRAENKNILERLKKLEDRLK